MFFFYSECMHMKQKETTEHICWNDRNKSDIHNSNTVLLEEITTIITFTIVYFTSPFLFPPKIENIAKFLRSFTQGACFWAVTKNNNLILPFFFIYLGSIKLYLMPFWKKSVIETGCRSMIASHHFRVSGQFLNISEKYEWQLDPLFFIRVNM